MPKKNLLIRTDANAAVGMGHLVRCVSLAKMLDGEFSITFLLSNTPVDIAESTIGKVYETVFLQRVSLSDESILVSNIAIEKSAHVLVLDGYEFDYGYQKRTYSEKYRTAYIDDLIANRYCVDLLINQADNVFPEQYATDSNAKLLLGPRYALLRPEFLEMARVPAREITEIECVFVNFGGVDSANITQRVLRSLVSGHPFNKIQVLLGQQSSSSMALKEEWHANSSICFHFNQSARQIRDLLAESDLAIVPNSTMSLEACSVGVLMITGVTADNQLGYSTAFQKSNLSTDVGDWRVFNQEKLRRAICAVMQLTSKEKLTQLSNQKKYIDGLSGQRILHNIQRL